MTTKSAALALLATAPLLTACPGPIKPVFPVPSLASILGPDWAMIVPPDADMVPGAIVKMTGTDGGPPRTDAPIDITPLSTLASCGVPASAVVVKPGATPAMSSDGTATVDAKLAATIAHIDIGSLGANYSHDVTMKVDDASEAWLDVGKLGQFLSVPANRQAVQSACPSLFDPANPDAANIYIVQIAYVISAGSFSFKNALGATISVTPGPAAPVTASAGASTGTNGTLTVTTPIAFAVKVLAPSAQFGLSMVNLAPTHHHAARYRHGPAPVAVAAPPPLSQAPFMLNAGNTVIVRPAPSH